MEFHVSSKLRKECQFDQKLFSYDGNVIFADFRAVREFAQLLNQRRAKSGSLAPVPASLLNALGLIDEIMHVVIDQYEKSIQLSLNACAYDWLEAQLGEETFFSTLEAFCLEFPPEPVYQGQMTVQQYLSEKNPQGKNNRYETIEEILLLWVTNRNPAAMKAAGELFDEKNLTEHSAYSKMIFQLNNYIKTLPLIEGKTLIEFLRAPAIDHPDSLMDQLEVIRLRWASMLGEYLRRMLLGLDWIKEEEKAHFSGPGPSEIPVYDDINHNAEIEYEMFSPDQDWMPRLVLIAKNTYVWLDQLSKKYGRHIRKLNEIPDEELQILSAEGFTGLWLIGLWQRSQASATIKQYCGNPEAIASAYSLAGYQIADELGGEDALTELRRKAWRFGIRLASDMVPNHMGIDSNWVLYHPDRFLYLDYSPFPSYTFNGPNLSPDPNIGIYIEDHYYNRSDAAVVFQRVDFSNGNVRYIYHGNDGTSMPWNDTAQLNYLEESVRQTVIQTILDVARRFPIIRFDAAMTLAKKHYQRLWFPEPGSGGDIATRAEHGMSKEDFDRVFPVEFWREVVDRVAVETPGTLLLAEAFWMMESYFVRTLGMHRVYNSAFMNMLRDEDNSRYRILLKNTLEFDPEILKRYVNFMNNPDERTAVEQFGKGDKYFGICILMVTMPGLPMFGHGQIEGYKEKYGMEYKRAYMDEQIDLDLLSRHEREISPLLHKRKRFAEVENFVLFDFANSYGNVDDNVFAYANYGEDRHTLVIVNNRFGNTSGFVRQSVPFAKKQDGEKQIIQRTLSESLGLHDDADNFVVMHDAISNLYFLRSSSRICQEGLYFDLHAYQYFVFDEIYEVHDDTDGSWRKLFVWLDGAGTPDINDSIQELTLHHVLAPYRSCFDGKKLKWLSGKRGFKPDADTWQEIVGGTWDDFKHLTDAAREYFGIQEASDDLFSVYNSGIRSMLRTPNEKKIPGMLAYNRLMDELAHVNEENNDLWVLLLIAQQQRLSVRFEQDEEVRCEKYNMMDEWHLQKSLRKIIHDNDSYSISPYDQIDLIQWLYCRLDDINQWQEKTLSSDLDELLQQTDTQQLLKVNTYEKIRWFNKEMAEVLVSLLLLIGTYGDAFDEDTRTQFSEYARRMKKAADMLQSRIAKSEYHFDRLFTQPEITEDLNKAAAE